MSNFSLLWGKILLSSIWIKESKATKLVWVAILALKDGDGKVQSSVLGLADAAKVSVEECREALRVFTSPDPDDTSHVEEGRRLRVIHGGWEVVNNDLYKYSSDEKREFWKQQKAEQRLAKAKREAEALEEAAKKAEKKLKRGGPQARETVFEKLNGDGDTATCDRLAAPVTVNPETNGNFVVEVNGVAVPQVEFDAASAPDPEYCQNCGNVVPEQPGKTLCNDCLNGKDV